MSRVSNAELDAMLGVCRPEDRGMDSRYVSLVDLRDDLKDARARITELEPFVSRLDPEGKNVVTAMANLLAMEAALLESEDVIREHCIAKDLSLPVVSAALARLAALREALNDIMYGDNGESWLDESFAPRSLADRACHVLADTATVAQEHDARIRAKALEEAAKEAEKIEPGGIHADDAPRSTSALLNAAVEMTGKLCRTGIAKRIRALIPLESQGTLPAGNPNEAASGSTPADCLAPDKKPAGAKPQTGSSVAMQEAHNLFTLILGATYDVGMGDRTKEEALSECTKLAHDGMRVTSLPSQEAPE